MVIRIVYPTKKILSTSKKKWMLVPTLSLRNCFLKSRHFINFMMIVEKLVSLVQSYLEYFQYKYTIIFVKRYVLINILIRVSIH